MSPTNHEHGEGWPEYRRLILQFCEETKVELKDISERLNEIDLELNTIKLKIALFAGGCGFVGSLIPVLAHYLVMKWMG